MALSRYQLIDAYTREELRREYQASNAKGRVRLLPGLYQEGVPPYEITLMAVEDPNVEVRQWIARNGKYLDYRDRGSINERSEAVEAARAILKPDGDPLLHESPDRNLESRLIHDPAPFVRACLRENPGVFDVFGFISHWKEYFHEATHLERLALVRNPAVSADLIEKIFDPADTELDIDLVARRELIFAFLTNTEFLVKQAKKAGLTGNPLDMLPYDYWEANFLSRLWEHASKWTDPWFQIAQMVYRYVPAADETKAKIYHRTMPTPQTGDKRPRQEPEENEELKEDEEGDEQTQELQGLALLKREILEDCSPDDSQTTRLGMRDPDEMCRYLAFWKVRDLDPGVFEVALRGEDKRGALMGLACNESLSVADLEKVRDRFRELGADDDAHMVWLTIQKVQKSQKPRVPENPKELFGYKGREGDFLEDKIDFLGKRLLSFEQERERQRARKLWGLFSEDDLLVGGTIGWVVLIVGGATLAAITFLQWIFK